MVNVVVVVLFGAVIVSYGMVLIGYRRWWRLPLVTRSRGPEEITGWVVNVLYAGGGVIQVGLSTRDERPVAEVVDRLVHLRWYERVPKVGDLIVVSTMRWEYAAKGCTLNWVAAWGFIVSIPSGYRDRTRPSFVID